MYELNNRPSRSNPWLPVLAVGTLLFGACAMVMVGGIWWYSLSGSDAAPAAAPANSLISRPVPVNAATPVPQVVIQPPAEGLDYESAVLRNLYEQVNPSVVNVASLSSHPPLEEGSSTTDLLPQGSNSDSLLVYSTGSGFVWNTAGYIVTNYHVVEGAEQVQVTFSDGTTTVAELVAVDDDTDLAVIRIDPTGYTLTPVRIGAMEDVFVGMRVAAIGNPFGLAGTLTSGIVSALGRSIPSLDRYQIPSAIQTDAPINPGNSGGPLLNEQGEVIGVNAQIRSETRANSGVGFAIPISVVGRVVPALIETGEYRHAFLGISGDTFNPICADEMGLDPTLRGALVVRTENRGPAAQAGLRGMTRDAATKYPDLCPGATGGDLITAVEGEPVGSFDDLLVYLQRFTSPGDTIRLNILRDGQEGMVELTLGARP
jgi:serine protease Do